MGRDFVHNINEAAPPPVAEGIVATARNGQTGQFQKFHVSRLRAGHAGSEGTSSRMMSSLARRMIDAGEPGHPRAGGGTQFLPKPAGL
jgi:hypothetical protein